MKKKQTFNQFCKSNCDDMYTEGLTDEEQCTGYQMLKKMIQDDIEPASLTEMKRWEANPTLEELTTIPDIKYLRFIHVNLRPHIVNNWEYIKQLEL